MFNNDFEYASTRLVGSVVKLKNFDEGGVLLVNKLIPVDKAKKLSFKDSALVGTTIKQSICQVPTDKMEFSFGPLGYMTTVDKGCAYVVRMPIRRDYKQGIRPNQLIAIFPDRKGGTVSSSVRDTNISDASFLKALALCAHNQYPDLDTCLELVEETGLGYGLSKHFAIGDKYDINYRGRRVGKLKNGLLKLDDKFNFIEQELVAELGHDKLAG